MANDASAAVLGLTPPSPDGPEGVSPQGTEHRAQDDCAGCAPTPGLGANPLRIAAGRDARGGSRIHS